MKKFITCCKPYLAKILFVVLSVLLICGFAACWWQCNRWSVLLCASIAMALEMSVSFFISYLPRYNYTFFRKAHYLCFALWDVVFVIGILFSTIPDKSTLVAATLLIVVFCALFSDLAVIAHLMDTRPKDYIT